MYLPQLKSLWTGGLLQYQELMDLFSNPDLIKLLSEKDSAEGRGK